MWQYTCPQPRIHFVFEAIFYWISTGFIHHLIELAGGTNVAARAKSPYPRLNMEEVLKEETPKEAPAKPAGL